MHSTKLSPRPAAEEVERLRHYLRPFRKIYKHLAPRVNARGKCELRLRIPGKKSTVIAIDPMRESAAFHTEYMRLVNGGEPAREFNGTRQNPGSHAEGTWNAALDGWLASAAYAKTSANTKENYRGGVDLVRRTFGPDLMKHTTPKQVRALVNGLIDKDKLYDANQLMTVLNKAIDRGHRDEWLTADLMRGIAKQKQKNEEGHRPYEDHEVAHWRASYGPETMARISFEFAYNHALGRSDVIRVAPCHIHTRKEDGATILCIKRRKSKKWQASVIDHPVLLAFIANHVVAADEPVDMRGQSTVPFLRNGSGKPYTYGIDDHDMEKGADTYGAAFKRWVNAIKTDAIKLEGFVPHGGRKAFARDAMNEGLTENDAMKVMGQTDVRVFRHYAQRSNAILAGVRASGAVAKARRERVEEAA